MSSTIGTRIRQYRKEAALSLTDLAAKTKIDLSQLSKMEMDKFDLPSVERIRRIARALNVMPNDIILGGALALREQQRIDKANIEKAAKELAGEL